MVTLYEAFEITIQSRSFRSKVFRRPIAPKDENP